jgi:hypothetical protein
MKKILFILLLLNLLSCYQLEKDCKKFKTGNFSAELTYKNKKYVSSFSRNDSIQIETYENKTDTFSIRWLNDCEYVLQNLNPKNREEKKGIHVKILSSNKEKYNFEYNFVGEDNKATGEVTLLK